MSSDAHWMSLALAQARAAGDAGEVPVGAVVVKDGVVVGVGRNAPVEQHDPTAHAEVAALRSAALALGNYRLEGCELFVTLEPCAMCAGAILHARIARVVFGAADPRTGAAGSVVDLFAQQRLNHQTVVASGVMEEPCGRILQDFFRARREQARSIAQPLRDDALRTPDERFDGLPADPWPARYIADLPALAGWRMHYLDSAPEAGEAACVLLHGAGQWGLVHHALAAALAQQGCPRILIPDLIGFGRSDKPKREAAHTLEWHRDVLVQWLAKAGVKRVIFISAASMRAIADAVVAAMPGQNCVSLVVDESAHPEFTAAWRAPFPDKGFEAALRAFGKPDRALGIDADRVQAAAREAMGYFQA